MNWISNSQYGCLAKTSNSLALADATNYVSSYLDKHDFTMDRFVKVKKAFDTVDRSYDKKNGLLCCTEFIKYFLEIISL